MPGQRRQLYLGCTRARHAQIGIDAIVNARGGLQHLNNRGPEEEALHRDAEGMRRYKAERVRWYGPCSRFFFRHKAKIDHLIARRF